MIFRCGQSMFRAGQRLQENLGHADGCAAVDAENAALRQVRAYHLQEPAVTDAGADRNADSA